MIDSSYTAQPLRIPCIALRAVLPSNSLHRRRDGQIKTTAMKQMFNIKPNVMHDPRREKKKTAI
jgi:hypothetical protein